MASSFTWLDYSEYERRKMLDVIELFGERTTRDELGLGGGRRCRPYAQRVDQGPAFRRRLLAVCRDQLQE